MIKKTCECCNEEFSVKEHNAGITSMKICRSCQIGNHFSNCSKPYGARGIKVGGESG